MGELGAIGIGVALGVPITLVREALLRRTRPAGASGDDEQPPATTQGE